VWEYPGYGCAQGTASEATVNLNAWAVLNFIRRDMQWPLNRLVLFGQSIGTGPTLHLAAALNRRNEHLAGIVLQRYAPQSFMFGVAHLLISRFDDFYSAYTSIRDVIRNMVGGLARVVSNRWSNDVEIKAIRDPILFIHGRRDPLIPFTQSETLFHMAEMKEKQIALCEATHNDWDHMNDLIRLVCFPTIHPVTSLTIPLKIMCI
jgi:pimeloyl-ACP methyl ester carboxylesterase